MNLKRIRRLYREERPSVRWRGGRGRGLGTRTSAPGRSVRISRGASTLFRMRRPVAGGSRCRAWSTTSCRTRWRQCWKPRPAALGWCANSTAGDAAQGGKRPVAGQCPPATIGSDNGTELTSVAGRRRAAERGVEWRSLAPGGPQHDAFVESVNGRLRKAWLNEHEFRSLAEARSLVGSWLEDDTRVRPHGSLGAGTPGNPARYNSRQKDRVRALRYPRAPFPLPG